MVSAPEFRAFRTLAIGVSAFGAAVLLGLSPLGALPASAQYDDCGFPPDVHERSIALRHHITCAEAKRVLLKLKGDRPSRTIPMVCGRSRVVQGWHLSNDQRAFNVVFTKYRRGKVSFSYHRAQTPGREWCRPPGGSGEPVGG